MEARKTLPTRLECEYDFIIDGSKENIGGKGKYVFFGGREKGLLPIRKKSIAFFHYGFEKICSLR